MLLTPNLSAPLGTGSTFLRELSTFDRLMRRFLASLFALWTTLAAGLAAERAWDPEAAARYSKRTGGTVLLIRRAGMPEVDAYSSGYSAATPVHILSITKSITALACLLEPRINLDATVPGKKGRQPFTIRELLSQTSGLLPGYELLYRSELRNVRSAAAALPSKDRPGCVFAYGPAHFEFLGHRLDPDDQPPDAARLLVEKRVLSPLRIHPAAWRTDRAGNAFLSAGLYLTPTDLLKIGSLILKLQKSPRSRIHQAFVGSPANPAYGLGFWLNRRSPDGVECDAEKAISSNAPGRMCLSRSAPNDLIAMVGSGGQRVYVIPSLDTVIVRLGKPGGFSDPKFLAALFPPARPAMAGALAERGSAR